MRLLLLWNNQNQTEEKKKGHTGPWERCRATGKGRTVGLGIMEEVGACWWDFVEEEKPFSTMRPTRWLLPISLSFFAAAAAERPKGGCRFFCCCCCCWDFFPNPVMSIALHLLRNTSSSKTSSSAFWSRLLLIVMFSRSTQLVFQLRVTGFQLFIYYYFLFLLQVRFQFKCRQSNTCGPQFFDPTGINWRTQP